MVTAGPELTLTKSVDKATATPGETLVYTLSYSNTGDADATLTEITDVVPAFTTFAVASGGGTEAAGIVTWSLGTIAAGASGSVTLTVTLDSVFPVGTTTVTNSAVVVSPDNPPVPPTPDVPTDVTVLLTDGRMTGGGTFGAQRARHGFTLHCDVNEVPNRLEVNWGQGNRFHLEQLTAAICLDDPSISPQTPVAEFDTYRGAGIGRYNGQPATAEWVFTDAGQPGRLDTATIVIRDAAGDVVLDASGLISNGNQQAH